MSKRLRIGISASFFHKDYKRPIFKGKTLLYHEESLGQWVMSEDAYAYMIPFPASKVGPTLFEIVEDFDGLVLQGGSDVSPKSYGEQPIRPEWSGDFVRDSYELELVRAFMEQGKPILGICRGLQLLNVAFGGTLFQDINTQVPNSLVHRNWDIYDQNFHDIVFEPGSKLKRLYRRLDGARVNSVHHQAVKKLGKDLAVEATSEKDKIIEAFRHTGDTFVCAVQWHPEFQDPKDSGLLDTKPLLREFLAEAMKRRDGQQEPRVKKVAKKKR